MWKRHLSEISLVQATNYIRMTAAKRSITKARVFGKVVEVAVEKAASLQSSLPQKQVDASFKVSSPMSKETPACRFCNVCIISSYSGKEPGATPETHPDVWEFAAPQLHPPALTPSMAADQT